MGYALSRMTDPRLRLILITDGAGDLARIEAVVTAALRGGCRCVQLRERTWSARQHAAACERLQPLLDAAGGLLLVNDRVDVASAGLAHGAQVGHRSLAPAAARQALPRPALLGSSTHDARELDGAAAAGCDFALLAPVWVDLIYGEGDWPVFLICAALGLLSGGLLMWLGRLEFFALLSLFLPRFWSR